MFFDAMSEDDLGAGLMHARLAAEGAAFPPHHAKSGRDGDPGFSRLIERPSGEDFGNFGDIFLRVAAVYAERVQLHQFAAVVFVQAAGLPGFVAAWTLWTTVRTGAMAAPVLVRGDAERDFRVRPDAQP